MPGSVGQAFTQFLSRIELNPTRVTLASQRYNAIKEHLGKALPGATVRQIGSFQKRTKIRPADLSDALDVDGLVVLGTAHNFVQGGLTPAGALAKVSGALKDAKTYKLMQPEIDAPTVTLEYSDSFRVELAVGYEDQTGRHPRPAGPPCYIVAGAANWDPTDYDFDAQTISGLNGQPANEGAIVPAIKMMKHYLRGADVPLNSFHVELLVCGTLPGAIASWAAKGQSWGLQHAVAAVLSSARPLMKSGLTLTGSHSPPVTSGLSTDEMGTIGAFFEKAGALAWNICSVAEPDVAVERWRTFFGDPFPPWGSVGR
ncbi:MAG TPA: hypothetical protein VHJ20_00940 [Polyangia bacterium]|nr:hypothetical protein [Polyangia bacterium]